LRKNWTLGEAVWRGGNENLLGGELARLALVLVKAPRFIFSVGWKNHVMADN